MHNKLPLSLLTFLLLSTCALAIRNTSQGAGTCQQSCQIDRINAQEPTSRIESEGGITEFWDHNNNEFQCAGASLRRHILQANSLMLPAYHNAPVLVYIIQGRGIYGVMISGCPETFESSQESQQGDRRQMFLDRHQKIGHYQEGDIIAIPAGAAHWAYNDAEQESVFVVLVDVTNNANQLDPNPRTFFLAGSPQLQQGQQGTPGQPEMGNIFKGFDTETLAEVFRVDPETASKLRGENDERGHFIKIPRGLQVISPPIIRGGGEYQPGTVWPGGEKGPGSQGYEPGSEEYRPWQRPGKYQPGRPGSPGYQPEHPGSFRPTTRPDQPGTEEYPPWQRPGYQPGESEGYQPEHPGSFRPTSRPDQPGSKGYQPSQRPGSYQPGEQTPGSHGYQPGGSEGYQPEHPGSFRPTTRPDQPGSEGYQPWQRPGQPGSKGYQPSQRPGSHEYQPGGSEGYQPEHPGSFRPTTRPDQPGTEGYHPWQRPGQPGYQPSQRPGSPSSEGYQPWQRPGQPGYQPSQRPGSPGSEGYQPWQRPGQPGSKGYQPSQRPGSYQPGEISPGSHGYQPGEKEGYQPEQPGSFRPTTRPDQPGTEGYQPWQRPGSHQPSQRPGSPGSEGHQPWQRPGQSGSKGYQPSQRPGSYQPGERWPGSKGYQPEKPGTDRPTTRPGSSERSCPVGCMPESEGCGVADNGLEETICTVKNRENINNPARADIYNPRAGQLSTVNSLTLPILSFLQLSASRGVLHRNAIMSPHWCMNANRIMYIVRGDCRMQIVDHRGQPVFDGQVTEGQAIVVPQNFAVVKQAGEQGAEWIVFNTNDNAMLNTLSGRTSALRGLPATVLSNAYQISNEQAQRLKYNRQETLFFSGSGSGRQGRVQIPKYEGGAGRIAVA